MWHPDAPLTAGERYTLKYTFELWPDCRPQQGEVSFAVVATPRPPLQVDVAARIVDHEAAAYVDLDGECGPADPRCEGIDRCCVAVEPRVERTLTIELRTTLPSELEAYYRVAITPRTFVGTTEYPTFSGESGDTTYALGDLPMEVAPPDARSACFELTVTDIASGQVTRSEHCAAPADYHRATFTGCTAACAGLAAEFVEEVPDRASTEVSEFAESLVAEPESRGGSGCTGAPSAAWALLVAATFVLRRRRVGSGVP